MRPSVIDVAKACGVSPSTVCRALNDHADINEKTRKKIMTACTRLGYSRNAAARSLRLSGSGAVALLTHDQTHELFIEKALALKNALGAAGLPWRLWTCAGDDDAEQVIDEIIGFRPLGFITTGGLPASTFKLLARNKIPVVCHDVDIAGVDCVALDRETAAFKTVSHLLKSGRRRVLALGLGTLSDRVSGYRKAHAEGGVMIDQALDWNTPYGHNLFEYGHQQTLQALEQVAFDAVYAVNDACAIGAIRALKEKGRNVPEDVAVAGFDDIMAAAFVTPSLTTAAQPKEEMARLAVEFLLARIRDPQTPRQFARLDAEIRRRESA